MSAGDQTRERIMTVASRVLTRDGQASVATIAKAAKVSRTTLYRAFPSRDDLLRALKMDPEPNTRQRVLEAALRLLATQSLTALSMDELAVSAGISRANLYRLFPGKAALFQAILLTYSPFEPVTAVLGRLHDRPPEDVIPEMVRTAYRTMAGRTGIMRTLIFEVTSMSDETQEAFRETGLKGFAMLARYLQQQMAAGRLRPMPPLLAIQGLIGGVMLHLLGPLFGEMTGLDGETAVAQLAENWLRGMRPGE
ncbi:MAG TPA: TetR/AcrR family transcriptional regulator [Candidatus Dormibacteraeota bacterium]